MFSWHIPMLSINIFYQNGDITQQKKVPRQSLFKTSPIRHKYYRSGSPTFEVYLFDALLQ